MFHKLYSSGSLHSYLRVTVVTCTVCVAEDISGDANGSVNSLAVHVTAFREASILSNTLL